MNQKKLERLANIEGYEDVHELLVAASTDSVVPAICVTDGCENTDQLEPDAQNVHCSECGNDTMNSCLILAGVI